MPSVPLEVNLIHDTNRLRLNDGVNYELSKNPFKRQIAPRKKDGTFDSVTETIYLNIRGANYQEVQNNIDQLVRRVDKVSRWKSGELNNGLVLECLISGATTIEQYKAFGARIHDIKLVLPESDLNFALYQGLPNVSLEVTRGPWLDAWQYQQYFQNTGGTISGTVASVSQPTTLLFTVPKEPDFYALCNITISGFSTSTGGSAAAGISELENAYVIANQGIALSEVAENMTFSVPNFTLASGTNITDASAYLGEYRAFTSPIKNEWYAARSNTYGFLSKKYECFAVVSGIGNWSLRAGIVEQNTPPRTFFTPETFFAGSTIPTVIYLGMVEASTGVTTQTIAFAYKRLSDTAANLGVDAVYMFGAEKPVSIIKINVPNVASTSSQYVHIVQPELFNTHIVPIDTWNSHSIIAEGRPKAFISNNDNLAYDIPVSTVTSLGAINAKRENNAEWFNDNFVYALNDTHFVTVLGVNQSGWSIRNNNTPVFLKWFPRITIGLIDVYPYLPRI